MDTRTKRQKLEAMANQTASPEEAAIAKEMLNKLDDKIDLIAIKIIFDGNKIEYTWVDQFYGTHKFWPISSQYGIISSLAGDVPSNLRDFTLNNKITY